MTFQTGTTLKVKYPRLPETIDPQIVYLRFCLGVTLVLGVLAVIDERQYATEIGVWAVSPDWRWAISIGWSLLTLVGLSLLSTWYMQEKFWIRLGDRLSSAIARLGALRLIVGLMLGMVYPALILGPIGRYVTPFFTRLLIFWGLVLVSSVLFQNKQQTNSPIFTFSATALLFGLIHRAAVFAGDLSVYPFSLGWSEASRYYYASLFFSERIYGISAPTSVLHPTRYLLQSVPFIVPGVDLFGHRLWQVLLWLGMSVLVAIVLARRLAIKSVWDRLFVITWAVLFLFQGPVWYHLSIMVVVILWWVRAERPWMTTAAVIVASLWAGLSRVNWIPVPAMLAVLLILLENRRSDHPGRELIPWSAVWILTGITAGFTSQWLYMLASGNDAGRFGSSFASALLWYRLLPSATYPLGVLPGVIAISLPVVILVRWSFSNNSHRMHPLRAFGMVIILIALLAGGILVSVKIGGGSNLHNLDAYLVALMIIGAYALFDRRVPDGYAETDAAPLPLFMLLPVVWIPIAFAIGMGASLRHFDLDRAHNTLEQIRSIAERAGERGEEALFISQRHLLALGMIENVELVPEYETVFLMEMAMSGNRDYLDAFHADLSAQRFDLIVVDRLSTTIQGRDHNFAEENNAWVEEVSEPILCNYVETDRFSTPPLQILVPRDPSDRCDT